MANQRLMHDAAIAMAYALVGVIAPCLREDEQRDCFAEFYTICKAGIEGYELQVDRMRHRLRPTKN